MQCKNHSEKEAVAICVSCGKAVCDECDVILQGKHYCKECTEEIDQQPIDQERVKKASSEINGFLWFVFSLMPGAGHMYMGLMKKGVMILGVFLATVAFNGLFYMITLGSLLSVLVYVYAFFDSLSTKKALQKGEVVFDQGFEHLSLEKVNLYYIGIGIIAIGILTLIRINLSIFNFLPIVRDIFYGIQRSILPIVLIVIGIWLIQRSKDKRKDQE